MTSARPLSALNVLLFVASADHVGAAIMSSLLPTVPVVTVDQRHSVFMIESADFVARKIQDAFSNVGARKMCGGAGVGSGVVVCTE